jgi:hypothetical protein
MIGVGALLRPVQPHLFRRHSGALAHAVVAHVR